MIRPILPVSATLTIGEHVMDVKISSFALEPGWVYNGSSAVIDCEVTIKGDVNLPNPNYDPNFKAATTKSRVKPEPDLLTDVDGDV